MIIKCIRTVMAATAVLAVARPVLPDDRDSLPIARVVVDPNINGLTPQFQTAGGRIIAEIKQGLEGEAVAQFNSTPHLGFFRWVDSAEANLDVAINVTLKLVKDGEIDPRIYLVPIVNVGAPLAIKSADFFEHENFILEGAALRDQMLRRKSAILTGLIISQREAWHSGVLSRVSLCRTVSTQSHWVVIPIDASQLKADRGSELEVKFDSTYQTTSDAEVYLRIQPRGHIGPQKCKVVRAEYDPLDIDQSKWSDEIPNVVEHFVPNTLKVMMKTYEPRLSSLANSPD